MLDFFRRILPKSFGGREKAAVALITGGALAAVGTAAYVRIRDASRAEELRKRYHILESYVSPTVLLYYDADTVQALKPPVLGKGYGVLTVPDADSARLAMQEVPNISAIVCEKGSGIDRESVDVPVIYAERIPMGPKRLTKGPCARERWTANLEDLVAAIVYGVESHESRGYRDLRRVLGYVVGVSLQTDAFEEIPEENKPSLERLILIHGPTLEDSFDAHKGGVSTTSPTQEPINKKTAYTSNGICMKLVTNAERDKLWEDYLYFSSPESGQVSRFARPICYADLRNGKSVVFLERGIWPKMNYVYSALVAEGGSPGFDADAAIMSTIKARLSVAAKYDKHYRELESVTPKRVMQTVEYYRMQGRAAFERLEHFGHMAGLERRDFEFALSIFDHESLRRPEFYSPRIMDLLSGNARLMLDVMIEEPESEEIRRFYQQHMGNGRGFDVHAIEQRLFVYDPLYGDRHLCDVYVSAAFPPELGPVENEAWIELAEYYLITENLAAHASRRFGLRAVRRTMSMARRSHGQASTPEQVIGENFFGLIAYRTLRRTDDTLKAARRNETEYAHGMISRDDYVARRNSYIMNAHVNGENLWRLGLTGALTIDELRTSDKPPRSLEELSAITRRSFQRVSGMLGHPIGIQSFKDDFSRKLAVYACVGRYVAQSGEHIVMMLDEARQSSRFKVELP